MHERVEFLFNLPTNFLAFRDQCFNKVAIIPMGIIHGIIPIDFVLYSSGGAIPDATLTTRDGTDTPSDPTESEKTTAEELLPKTSATTSAGSGEVDSTTAIPIDELQDIDQTTAGEIEETTLMPADEADETEEVDKEGTIDATTPADISFVEVETSTGAVSGQEEKEGEVTTESAIIEATTLPSLELGECLKDGVVYENGTEVKPGKCEEFCVCEQGFVNCERKACPAPPPAFLRCAPLEDADQCCPTYDCRKCYLISVLH